MGEGEGFEGTVAGATVGYSGVVGGQQNDEEVAEVIEVVATAGRGGNG